MSLPPIKVSRVAAMTQCALWLSPVHCEFYNLHDGGGRRFSFQATQSNGCAPVFTAERPSMYFYRGGILFRGNLIITQIDTAWLLFLALSTSASVLVQKPPNKRPAQGGSGSTSGCGDAGWLMAANKILQKHSVEDGNQITKLFLWVKIMQKLICQRFLNSNIPKKYIWDIHLISSPS